MRARGGHILIDEIVTGPVLSSKERKQARIAESPADVVSLAPSSALTASGVGTTRTREGSPPLPGKETALEKAQLKDDCSGSPGERPRSKLGKGIDVFLAEARDKSCSAMATRGAGEQAAHVSLMVKTNLETRRNRRPRGRNNAKKSIGSDLRGSDSDPFGRPMTTMQRRLAAAWEIAEDGGDDGNLHDFLPVMRGPSRPLLTRALCFGNEYLVCQCMRSLLETPRYQQACSGADVKNHRRQIDLEGIAKVRLTRVLLEAWLRR